MRGNGSCKLEPSEKYISTRERTKEEGKIKKKKKDIATPIITPRKKGNNHIYLSLSHVSLLLLAVEVRQRLVDAAMQLGNLEQ